MKQTGFLKRSLALLLCFLMVFSAIPTAAFAAETGETSSAGAKVDTGSGKDTMPAAEDTTSIEIEQLSVRMADSNGNYILYKDAKQDGANYWAYLIPGETCPGTVPEAEVADSALEGCKDHIYRWGDSYIQISMLSSYTISKMEWNSNVLKFTVNAGGGQTREFTLTLKDRSNGEITLAALLEKIKGSLTISMADNYNAIAEKVKAVEVPDWMTIELAGHGGLHLSAAAGTKENPDGTDGTMRLNLRIRLIDEVDSSTVQIKGAKSDTLVVEVVDHALRYDETSQVALTAKAYGDGKATAEFTGVKAFKKDDGSYTWGSQYTLTAEPGDKIRFIQWDYTGDKPLEMTSDVNGTAIMQKKMYVTVAAEQTFTAYFAENQTPTISTSAPKSLSVQARTLNYSYNFYSSFKDSISITVDGKSYIRSDTLTYTITMDGEIVSESSNFKFSPSEPGSHTLVVTATDDLGESATLTVPLTVTAGSPTKYKFRVTATEKGNPVSLGEDGLNAKVSYYAGKSGNFPLDNLENEFFDSSNIYYVYIDDWANLRDNKQFYSVTIAGLEIPADDITTKWTVYKINNKARAFGTSYGTSKDQLILRVNDNRNMNNLSEDLTLQLNFDVPADYTPTVTVSEQGGGTIDDLKLKLNTGDGSTWKLTTTPKFSWILDYIQVGDDETTRISSEDGKTITWTVNKADQAYTAYFKKIQTAVLTDNWNLGGKADWAGRSVAFGEKGTFVFTNFKNVCTSPDYSTETEKNTLLYTEQVNFAAEVKIDAEYSKNSVFKGVIYNGEGTEGTILDQREAALGKDCVPGTYGVDFTFDLPVNAGKITMVLTLGAGSDGECVLTKTYDLTESGITFRAPVESDYIQVAVEVKPYIAPTMVKDFKFYGGMKFLLGAYEDVLNKEADKGYKSIVIDSVNGYMNAIVLSCEEPAIAGSVYTEKNFASGTWGWVTYYVNGVFVDLGIGSWAFYGDEIMQWSGLYSTKYGAEHTSAYLAGDPWGIAVLRKYYSDSELLAAGLGSSILTAKAMAEKWPDYADEILNRRIVPDEIKPVFDEVAEKINAIGEVTRDSGKAITDARNAYGALPKTFFGSAGYFMDLFAGTEPYSTALKTLEAAEVAFAELKDPDEQVEILIDAIGEVDLDSGKAILAARRAYDALTEEEKAKVDNYLTLTAAEATYTALQAEETSKLETLEKIYKNTGDYIAAQENYQFGSIGGEWAVIGLARSGKTVPDSYYTNILSHVQHYIDENERLDGNKVTDNARLILALTAIGKDVTNVGGHNLLKGMNDMDYIQTQGINGPIWTLLALDSHDYTSMGNVTREKLISVILEKQLSDGGWALIGELSDPDITGMAVTALAKYYDTNENVKKAIDKAVATLSNLQNADGSYSMNDGSADAISTAESTAQVITALAAMKIDPDKDSRFVKYGNSAIDALRKFYVSGGGFKHIAEGTLNGMATEQGYYALAAYYRMIYAQNSLYDMTDVTIQENSSEEIPGGNTGDGTNTPGGNTGDRTNTPGGNTGDGTNTPGGNTGDGTNTPGGNTGDGTNTSGGNTGDGMNTPGENTGDGTDISGENAGSGTGMNSSGNLSKTSDNSQLFLWAAAAVVSIGTAGAVLVLHRKKYNVNWYSVKKKYKLNVNFFHNTILNLQSIPIPLTHSNTYPHIHLAKDIHNGCVS